MRLATTVFVLSFPLMALAAPASLQQICVDNRPISKIEGAEDIKSNLLGLKHKFSDQDDITQTIDYILGSTLFKLEGAKKFNGVGILFKDDQKRIADLINEKYLVSYTPSSNRQLSRALGELVFNYNTLEKRSASRMQYIHDIEEVIGLTKIGKETLHCFQAARTENTFTSRVLFNEDLAEGNKIFSGSWMEFRISQNPTSPVTYNKDVLFETALDPLHGLISYFHELKHGCSSKEFIQNREKSQTTSNDGYAFIFSDELRAYRAQLEFYKELAIDSPPLICNWHYVSDFLGKQIVTLGEFHATFEKLFTEGGFPRFLGEYYRDTKTYPEEAVFEKNNFTPAFQKVIREVSEKLNFTHDLGK